MEKDCRRELKRCKSNLELNKEVRVRVGQGEILSGCRGEIIDGEITN